MTLPWEGKLLRIFVGEADRWHGRPLYEAIIEEGDRQVVYMQHGPGQYMAQEVRTGVRGELYSEVVEGLTADTLVVTFGSFFIDAEQKLKSGTPATQSDAHQHH